MTVTVMMGAMLKGDQKLTVTTDGRGPIGRIIADADAQGGVRAYVDHPQTHFPLSDQGRLNVRRAVGTDGSIQVIKDVGMKNYFSSASPIVSSKLEGDFTYYYTTGEQAPSSIRLSVLINPGNSIKAAGGFIIQVIPGATDETTTKLEEVIGQMQPVSKLTEQGLTPEGILNEVLGEDNAQTLNSTSTQFECNCSHERFLDAIRGLGEAEIHSTIKEDHRAEAICHFCGNKYQYSKSELKDLLETVK